MFSLCFTHRPKPTFVCCSSNANLIFRVFAVLFWSVWFILCPYSFHLSLILLADGVEGFPQVRQLGVSQWGISMVGHSWLCCFERSALGHTPMQHLMLFFSYQYSPPHAFLVPIMPRPKIKLAYRKWLLFWWKLHWRKLSGSLLLSKNPSHFSWKLVIFIFGYA